MEFKKHQESLYGRRFNFLTEWNGFYFKAHGSLEMRSIVQKSCKGYRYAFGEPLGEVKNFERNLISCNHKKN